MADDASEKLSNKEYARELKALHVELVKLQEWIKHKGLKVCIAFEGRDGAGKGGTIKAITERVSPRVFRVVALPAASEREKSQMYIQRYLPHFPAAGEVVIFDRSWYNRAGVERVMGFCTDQQAKDFLHAAPLVEKAMVESGIILLKYWLEVSPDEQTRRLESRIQDGRKIWKLTPMDLKSYSRWYDYSRARDEMFAATDTAWAPWYVVHSDDEKRARLNLITHFLSQVPYKEIKREKIKLPKRQKADGYREPAYPYKIVEERALANACCVVDFPGTEELVVITERQRTIGIYVDRATRQWIVRDPEGLFWTLPPGEEAWDRRQQFDLTAEADLESIPGHYKYLLKLPF